MNMVLKDLIEDGHVVVYMDNILIFAGSISHLTQLTHAVLAKLLAYDLFLKPKKCTFQATSIDYLRLHIEEG